MYYHASSIGGITRLEPRISNHGIPLIYFSQKRENVLVYLCNAIEKFCKETGFEVQIPDAATSSEPVTVTGVEYVPDAYEAILEAERKGLIRIERYEEMSEEKRAWLERTIRKEYEDAEESPDYRYFLEHKFPECISFKL